VAAKIENIEIVKRLSKEIRLDWSNDRHQAIELKTDDVYGVIEALEKIVYLLREEQFRGEL